MDKGYVPPGGAMPPPYPPPTYHPQGQLPPGYAPPMPVGPYPPAIVAQPGMGAIGMPMPTTTTYVMAENTSGGPLGYLGAVDQLIIKQEIHLADVVSNIKTDVKFDILNSQSQLVFRAEEQNECCNRECCGSNRSFDIFIKDASTGIDVIALHRPLRCCGCCFPCFCMQEMVVEAPPGCPIGTIIENWTLCSPSFTVYDGRDNTLFRVTGPCCPSNQVANMGQDVNFDVIDHASSQKIGIVSKQWAGFLQEAFTNASNFSVSFPLQLSVQHKAILLSMSFLLNFMFFERTPVQHQRHETDHHRTGINTSFGSSSHHHHHHSSAGHVSTSTTTY